MTMTITEYLASVDEGWKFILTDDDMMNIGLFANGLNKKSVGFEALTYPTDKT